MSPGVHPKWSWLDFFAYRGAPRPLHGETASRVGAAATVVMIAAIIAYAANSGVRFVAAAPFSFVTQQPTTKAQNTSMVPTCISTPGITNARFFTYELVEVTVDENGTQSERSVAMVHDAKRHSLCTSANHSGYLHSYCDQGSACSFVRFRLWTCGTPDPRNPSRASRDCAPLDEIAQVLETQYVTITYATIMGVIPVHSAPKVQFSALYSSIFIYNQSTRQPDYLRRWATSSRANLVLSDTSTYALSSYFAGGPTQQVLEVRMVLGPFWVQTVFNHRTTFDLLASWGAFFGVVASVLGFFFLRYNEAQFFAEYPQWLRITNVFTVERRVKSDEPLPARGSPLQSCAGAAETFDSLVS